MSDTFERRLSAIFAADVVGYSRMMGRDEAGTLQVLRLRRAAIIDPAVAQFGGRIVKTTGDGLLAEFPSVVAAVECAVAVQAGMRDADAGIPADRWLVLRIGVNLGDIILQDDDIFGDGVNIAARLEQIAPPGGVCISQAAYEQVRDKLDLRFEDIGEHTFKNIARPVRVYGLALEGAATAAGSTNRRAGGRWRYAVAGLLAILLVGGGGAAFLGLNPTGTVNAALPPSLENPSLSIAVLPFTNLSGDPDQDYFADALTEDLTADLSRISGSFVISRSTAATYRGQPIDVRLISRELGVRYLLEGTVRRGTDDVRVSVQLSDGDTGQQVWSERYEKTAGDMYTFQNEVTGRVARALNLELKEAESRQVQNGGGGNIDANDLALRGWAELWSKPQKPSTNRAALDFAIRAQAIDPDNVEALGVATYAYARAATYDWDMPRTEAIQKGIAAGERAMAVDPTNADTVYALGFIYYRMGETRQSLEMMRQSIALNRNHAPAYFFSGVNYIRLGKPREAIQWVERAFALSPRDPLRSVWYSVVARAEVLIGEDLKAIEAAIKGIAANPGHSQNFAVLASAYAHLDQMEKATAALSDFRRLQPKATLSGYVDLVAGDDPIARETYRRLIEGLAKAGLSG